MLSACGSGSDDVGGSATNSIFQRDVGLLADSKVNADAPAALDGFRKVFGGDTTSHVAQFIGERAKHVYSASEILKFRIDITDSTGAQGSFTLFDEVGADPFSDPNSALTVQGVNFGTSLAIGQHDQKLKMIVQMPTGPVEVTSPRVGLIGLTPAYSSTKVQTQSGAKTLIWPLEARVGILVHEGRHSDCPNGFEGQNCGYAHSRCTEGPAAGEIACDGDVWGPYAVEAVYLGAAKENWPADSNERRMIEFFYFDMLSRVSSEDLKKMADSFPELESL